MTTAILNVLILLCNGGNACVGSNAQCVLKKTEMHKAQGTKVTQTIRRTDMMACMSEFKKEKTND